MANFLIRSDDAVRSGRKVHHEEGVSADCAVVDFEEGAQGPDADGTVVEPLVPILERRVGLGGLIDVAVGVAAFAVLQLWVGRR